MGFPSFIIDRVMMYTLLVDKGLNHESFNERLTNLRAAMDEFLSSIETGFVSNNSDDFKAFLEDRVGAVRFNKNFAIRIRPGSVRFFVMGKEVFK